jgi:hypothetical protein
MRIMRSIGLGLLLSAGLVAVSLVSGPMEVGHSQFLTASDVQSVPNAAIVSIEPPVVLNTDPSLNIDELRQKAEAGDANAQISLASAYAFNRKVPQNYTEAAHWYEKVQSQGGRDFELETTLSYVGYIWKYDHYDDSMSTRRAHSATLKSLNTVNFSFPYSGEQRATLTLRNHPRYGKEVIFEIEKGQILCPSYDTCSVLVRFDDGEPTSFTAVGAADHSTETIFIKNYNRFIEKMLHAERVRISASVYQQGSPVFEFRVGGFNQGLYKDTP